MAIARALIHEPHLVLCDEPTAALDHDTGHAVMQLLAENARRADRAVIVVTHDNRIMDFADRIAFMEDGCIERVEAAPQRPRNVRPQVEDVLRIALGVELPKEGLGVSAGAWAAAS